MVHGSTSNLINPCEDQQNLQLWHYNYHVTKNNRCPISYLETQKVESPVLIKMELLYPRMDSTRNHSSATKMPGSANRSYIAASAEILYYRRVKLVACISIVAKFAKRGIILQLMLHAKISE